MSNWLIIWTITRRNNYEQNAQSNAPGRSTERMAAGRNDGNKGGQGVADFPRHPFKSVKRQGWSNGGDGLTSFSMVRYFTRCLARNANTVGFMASRATAK